MHAYRKLIQDEMDARQWQASDLARVSGVSKQVLSNILGDTREQLVQRPTDATVNGLARAFGLNPDAILAAVGEAMGLPVSRPVVIYDAARVSDDDLLRVLGERLRAAKDGGEHEHSSASNKPAGVSPAQVTGDDEGPVEPANQDEDSTALAPVEQLHPTAPAEVELPQAARRFPPGGSKKQQLAAVQDGAEQIEGTSSHDSIHADPEREGR